MTDSLADLKRCHTSVTVGEAEKPTLGDLRREADVETIHADLNELVATKLNPSAVKSKAAELVRYGLPSSSIPEGSRNADPKIPVVAHGRDEGGPADATDRDVRRRSKSYTRNIAEALRHVRLALEDQSWFLVPVGEMEDTKGDVFPCANINCVPDHEHPDWGFLEEGRKSGECSKCRTHRSKWGVAWPMIPETVDA